jgi:hypothetical protein
MSRLVWLHEDALRHDHPAILKAGADAPSVFIWDESYFRQMDYGFKRLVFLYETLCELPCDVYRGPLAGTLEQLIEERGVETVYAPFTPNPILQGVAKALSQKVHVVTVEDENFARLSKAPKLNRFFNYWKLAEKSAMSPDGQR